MKKQEYEFECNFRVAFNVNVVARNKEEAREKLLDAISDGKFSIQEYANETIGIELSDYTEDCETFDITDMHAFDYAEEIEITD